MILDTAKDVCKNWIQEEVGKTKFSDKRLENRFETILEQLWNNLGQPIPLACQDWANTKATYRFLSNDKITENKILKNHFESTKQRIKSISKGWILIIQDTTEFSYNRKKAEEIGWTKLFNSNNTLYKKCGLLMHSSLAITSEGLPLGLCAIKFWYRKDFKGTNEMKKIINPNRVTIENKESIKWLENLSHSMKLLGENRRCVHVGDRESDIYELFCLTNSLNTNFIIRSCHNRVIDSEYKKIEAKMKSIKAVGTYKLKLENYKDRKDEEVELSIKYQKVKLIVPFDKKKQYQDIHVTIVDAIESNCPEGITPIFWRLITNLNINSVEDATEKIEWYKNRWKIETFHKILKSGLKSESIKLQKAQRVINLLAIFCILGWRVFWITMMNRVVPTGPPSLILNKDEIKFFDKITDEKCKKTVASYVIEVAKLGGYLARKNDPPPGNLIIWRGMQKLNDMLYGYKLAKNETKESLNIEVNMT